MPGKRVVKPHERKPAFATEPKVDRQARAMAPVPSDGLISWRVREAEMDTGWHWSEISGEELRAVHEFLSQLETMTWGDATRGPRPRAKNIPFGDLVAEARQRLITIKKDDADLWELHMAGEPRIWGVRRGDTFSILWWDPDHHVCPSKKK